MNKETYSVESEKKFSKHSARKEKIFMYLSYEPIRFILNQMKKNQAFTYTQIVEILTGYGLDTPSSSAYYLNKLLKYQLVAKDKHTALYFITTKGKIAHKGIQYIMKANNLSVKNIDSRGRLEVKVVDSTDVTCLKCGDKI